MTENIENVLNGIEELKINSVESINVLRQYLSDINLKLEDISNSGEEFTIVRSGLADFKQSLILNFNNIFEKLETFKASIKNDESILSSMELLSQNLENIYQSLLGGLSGVGERFNDIEDGFTQLTETNFAKIKEEFSNISQMLSSHHQEIVQANRLREENIDEHFSFIIEGVKLFSDNLNVQTNIYKDFITNKAELVFDYIKNNEENLKEDNAQIRNEITNKLQEFTGINEKFESDLEVIKVAVAKLLEKTDNLNNTSMPISEGKLNSITITVEETIDQIRTLQDFSSGIVRSLNDINSFVQNNPTEEILEHLKNLDIKNEISKLFEELVQEKISNMFTSFDSTMQLLLTKVDDLESRFISENSSSFEKASEEFLNTIREIKINQQEILESDKILDESLAQHFSFVAESIKMVSENIGIQSNMYKDFMTSKTEEIQNFVNANNEALNNNNQAVRSLLEQKLAVLENSNIELANGIDTLKYSIGNIVVKANDLTQALTNNISKEFKDVALVAQDITGGIILLQDYCANVIRNVNYLVEMSKQGNSQDILNAIQEQNVAGNINAMFEKFDAFNNNLAEKTAFLNEQIEQVKHQIAFVEQDAKDREASRFDREALALQGICSQIDRTTEELRRIEEYLLKTCSDYVEQMSGIERKVSDYNDAMKVLFDDNTNFIQAEIAHSLDQLKEFISVNSNNYNDKLVLIGENLAQSYQKLEDIININVQKLFEADLRTFELAQENNSVLRSIDAKVDIIAQNDYTQSIDEINEKSEETQELVKLLQTKLDILLHTDFNLVPEKQELVNKKLLEYCNSVNNQAQKLTSFVQHAEDLQILEAHKQLLDLISQVDSKIDVIASIDYDDSFENILVEISNTKSSLISAFENEQAKTQDLIKGIDEKHQSLSLENKSIASENQELIIGNKDLLDALHAKLDIFVEANDNQVLADELENIKDMLLTQQLEIEQSKDENKELMSANISKLIERIDGVSTTVMEHDETSTKIKEDLVQTIISVFNNTNFIEESEDIKEFVESKTDEISKQLVDVQEQIETIKQNDISNYSYTLSDVENDIAKLRVALNDMSASTPSAEINEISKNIYSLISAFESLTRNLTPAELYQLKHNVLKLNDDILSISSRTNKILLNSDEAQRSIASGLNAFTHIAYNLEDRLKELSSREFNEETSQRLERILEMLDNSASMDKTLHKVLMYLGEWVETTSKTINETNEKLDEITEVSDAISELRKVLPEKIELINMLEERFEEQQSRLDRLELKLDELTEQAKTNSTVLQQTDKLERMLGTLTTNVEKLTSYVD